MKQVLGTLTLLIYGCSGGGDADSPSSNPIEAGADSPVEGSVDSSKDIDLGDDGKKDGPFEAADDASVDMGFEDGGPVESTERLVIDDLEYAGAFRVALQDAVSGSDYAVGTLAYHRARNSLFFAGHAHHNAVAEFVVPPLGDGNDVKALPAVSQSLQSFQQLLEKPPTGNPDGLDRITGMLVFDGQLLINAENWYDAGAGARDTTLVVRDATSLGGLVDGYFRLEGAARVAGYMAPIPSEWQAKLGGSHLSGWASNYSIVSRYSVGPSLFALDFADITASSSGAHGEVSTRAWMSFPHSGGHYLGEDALETHEGQAAALWNMLSRGLYGFIVPGTKTFAVFGSSGGIDSGIGYKITQNNGNLCGGYCAYDAADYYNHYWFFDLEEILSASATYEPRPYAFGRWKIPFDGNGRHLIMGGTFDEVDRKLYLALSEAGQVGEYDRPPVIVVYQL